ncbi:MAG TPA: hypothetical protein VGG64_14185 [Pirellulales bacterium]
MGIIKIAILASTIACSSLVGRGLASMPVPVTVEFIKKRSESAFKSGTGKSLVHYSLISTGEIRHRAHKLSDETIGRKIAYSGSVQRTQCIYLSIDVPEQTTFADLTAALERLKAVIAKNVTGNCNALIQAFPRDWALAPNPDVDSDTPAPPR